MNIFTPEVRDGLATFNEAAVRMRVLDPLLRKLGYFEGEGVYLKPEVPLSYPYGFIGHRSKKDYPIGSADYLAGLTGRRGSFIVEAKAAGVTITKSAIEQAHSYAAHAQVGANYFLLSNGRLTLVFATLSGSESEPILEVPINEIDTRFHEIENILSPKALEKHCRVKYDKGLKLCDELGSSLTIHSGEYSMDFWHLRVFANDQEIPQEVVIHIPEMKEPIAGLELMANEFPLRISNGLIERTKDGRITLSVEFDGVTHSNRQFLEDLGLKKMSFQTDEQFLSRTSESPTRFEAETEATLEKGEQAPVSLFGGTAPAEHHVATDLLIRALLYVESGRVLGIYSAISDTRHVLLDGTEIRLELDFSGEVSAEFQ